MISKSVTREQFEVRSELEVVHIPTGIVFRVHPYTDPRDRLQSIKVSGRVGVPTGEYFEQLQRVASQLLLERAVGDRRLGPSIENVYPDSARIRRPPLPNGAIRILPNG